MGIDYIETLKLEFQIILTCHRYSSSFDFFPQPFESGKTILGCTQTSSGPDLAPGLWVASPSHGLVVEIFLKKSDWDVLVRMGLSIPGLASLG